MSGGKKQDPIIQSLKSKFNVKLTKLKIFNSNIDTSKVIKMAMFEKFYDRVLQSNYKNDIVLKGGFVLAHLFGFTNRLSDDLDATIHNLQTNPSKEEVIKIFNEICGIELDDYTDFNVVGVRKILKWRHEFLDSGLRITLEVNMHGFRDRIHIDIETITGRETYDTNSWEKLNWMSNDANQNVLTNDTNAILTDKVLATITDNGYGTRYRDFYDIWFLIRKLNLNFDIKLISYNIFEKVEKYELALRELNNAIDYVNREKENLKVWVNSYANQYNDFIDDMLDSVNYIIKEVYKNGQK